MSDDYKGPERRRDSWHVKKELTIGHIVSTMIIASAAFWWAAETEKQIHANTQEIKHTKDMVEFQTKELNKTVNDVKKSVNKIDSKIDKLIDRELNK